jgi:hypothetical protein
MKKTALVFVGKEGYKEMLVDTNIMSKSRLVYGRICYVLNSVKTFPYVDIDATFGNVTAEKTWCRFTFEVSAKKDLRELVRYAVGLDRFGGFPIRFSSHSGKMTITTCKAGKLGGISKFLLSAMNDEAFTLNRTLIEFIDANGIRKPQTVVWERSYCEKFQTNTEITGEVQLLRKAYSKGKLA